MLECARVNALDKGVRVVRAAPGEAWGKLLEELSARVVLGYSCQTLESVSMVVFMVEAFVTPMLNSFS